MHETPLIATIASGLGLAFALGFLAQRLALPPIVGYLAAGVVVGPFTPGYVADQHLATELAEIGVILLMFGVGLHFSLRDLLAVRRIAIPGALAQIAAATVLGIALALALGWSWSAGLVFGLALSVASTVVLLRALQERDEDETEKGKIAVGWLIVEDLVMVFMLVLIPAFASMLGATPAATPDAGAAAGVAEGDLLTMLGLTVLKVGVFVALMLIVGRRLIPWIMHAVAHTGSRELFRLAVLAIALVVAFGSAKLFGVSFALGAFFAGMVLAESELSHQAAKETLPLRDAFAVLFFVSVGMLLNPDVILSQPLSLLATLAIIVFGKSIAAYGLVRSFGYPRDVALTVSASLAQIGEFSFILIVLSVQLGIVPEKARDLVVAGAILSIILNPFLFRLIDHLQAPPATEPETQDHRLQPQHAIEAGETRAVVVGHGRVGTAIADQLTARSVPFVVVEQDGGKIDALKQSGASVLVGVAGEPKILDRMALDRARVLLIAIPDPYEAGHLVEVARQANPSLPIIVRCHSKEAAHYLKTCGATTVISGEMEIAAAMVRSIGTDGVIETAPDPGRRTDPAA